MAHQLFDIGALARLHGERDTKRLRNWADLGLVRATHAAEGTGTRRRFTRGDALRVGLLLELRRLLGRHFRPGELAPTLDKLTMSLLDREQDPTPMWLVLYRSGDKYAQQFVDSAKLVHLLGRQPTALVINVTTLTQRVNAADPE